MQSKEIVFRRPLKDARGYIGTSFSTFRISVINLSRLHISRILYLTIAQNARHRGGCWHSKKLTILKPPKILLLCDRLLLHKLVYLLNGRESVVRLSFSAEALQKSTLKHFYQL
jgi:hypothetical protein